MPRRRFTPPSDIEPLFHFCRHCGGDYTPQEDGIEGGLPGVRRTPLLHLPRVRRAARAVLVQKRFRGIVEFIAPSRFTKESTRPFSSNYCI